jgi:PTS system mannose-specific IIA component
MPDMSTSILIIAHAPLAHALRQCALHVFPDCDDYVFALDVQPNMSPDESIASARIITMQMPGKKFLALTDIFGATPCNVAQKVVDGQSSRLVSGVNLPMLLRCITYRQEALDLLVTRAVAGGTQGVMQVAITAPQNQAKRNHDQDRHDHQQ